MMNLPLLNLDQIVEQIEWADVSERFRKDPTLVTPEEQMKFEGWGLWNQGAWATKDDEQAKTCGAAYCQAGEAVLRAGYRIAWDGRDHNVVNCYLGTRTKDTVMLSIPDVAREVLGLTSEEESLYFDGDNDLDDLKFYANAFAVRRGLPAPYTDDLVLNSPLDLGIHEVGDVIEHLNVQEPHYKADVLDVPNEVAEPSRV